MTKTLKDYFISAVKGKSFVDKNGRVYQVTGIGDLTDSQYGNEWVGIGVQTTLKPNQDPDYPKHMEDVLSDKEATPEEVQRAKESRLAQKTV